MWEPILHRTIETSQWPQCAHSLSVAGPAEHGAECVPAQHNDAFSQTSPNCFLSQRQHSLTVAYTQPSSHISSLFLIFGGRRQHFSPTDAHTNREDETSADFLEIVKSDFFQGSDCSPVVMLQKVQIF